MHLYKTMKNFLMDFNYYIDIYDNKIHVFDFVDILKLNDQEIALLMPSFKLQINGHGFVVKRLEKREILIEGVVDAVRFVR